MFGRRKQQPSDSSNPYDGLRRAALTESATLLAATAPPDVQVLGAVVDTAMSGGHATLVGFIDGTTSFYTSTGGGTIGAGAHAPVAAATATMLRVLESSVDMFPFDDQIDLPPVELVTITLITRAGRRRANVESAAFWGEVPSTIPDMIGSIQDVISAVRAVSPG